MSQRLWSKDFIFVTIVNLFMYLIHYMLIVTITHSQSKRTMLQKVLISSWCIYHWHVAGRLGAGRIIDHLQPKNVLIGGVIGSIIAIALYFTIHSILILMFVRFIHGIAFGFLQQQRVRFLD